MSAVVVLLAVVGWGARASAADSSDTDLSYAQTIARARQRAPDLVVARAREGIARAEVGVAGTYPNPTLIAGTSTQAARFSIGASIPLVVLGQRGAAIDASRADLATVRVETQGTWNEVRSAWLHPVRGHRTDGNLFDQRLLDGTARKERTHLLRANTRKIELADIGDAAAQGCDERLVHRRPLGAPRATQTATQTDLHAVSDEAENVTCDLRSASRALENVVLHDGSELSHGSPTRHGLVAIERLA